MGDERECSKGACQARVRPLAACESCGRHVARDAEVCPFCAKAGRGPLAKVIVAAAFFGSAAIAGCAYGPPPDDIDADASDGVSEVQQTVDSGGDSGGPEN